MKCTDQLSNDHKLILRALEILRAMGLRMEQERAVDPIDVQAVLDFFRKFADRCHHGKEEAVFFPALMRAGMPQDGPLGVMMFEHEQGRSLVGGMQDALERNSTGDFVVFATRYIHLLTNHIYKEDHILFDMAESVLTAEEDGQLMNEFEKVEQEMDKSHESFHRMIHDMEFRYLGKAA